MPVFRAHADIKPVAGALDRVAVNLKKVLPEIADRVITQVRAGNWFRNETGVLKKGLYKSNPRVTQSRGEIDVGWSGPASIYGPVLEFGPKRKAGWLIKPKGVKADGGKVKALRWVSNGQVHYAKSVWHQWTPRQLRPHYRKALAQLKPYMDRKLGAEVKIAWDKAGL